MRRKLDNRGQMTIELCIVLPVAIIIAVIAVNAMTFFSYCAEFDRVTRNAVRVAAASPSANQDKAVTVSSIKSQIINCVNASNTSCEVSSSVESNGLETYKATLKYWPTLFGMGLKDSVFGVKLPPLTHSSSLTVDRYTPGEIL